MRYITLGGWLWTVLVWALAAAIVAYAVAR